MIALAALSSTKMPRGCAKLLFAEAASNTLKINSSCADIPSASVTRNLMTTMPRCPAAGVTCTVRFAPLPPSARFAFGTRSGLDDATTASEPAAVSASPTVKLTAAGVWPGATI